MKTLHRFFLAAVSCVLALSVAVGLAGCGKSASSAPSTAASQVAVSEAADAKIQAVFTVTYADGTSEDFTLEAADGTALSDALLTAGLISEEEAAAGFVTTVNGVTADYSKDGAWWCLTDASGEPTTVGVADIALHDGDQYAFTYTK